MLKHVETWRAGHGAPRLHSFLSFLANAKEMMSAISADSPRWTSAKCLNLISSKPCCGVMKDTPSMVKGKIKTQKIWQHQDGSTNITSTIMDIYQHLISSNHPNYCRFSCSGHIFFCEGTAISKGSQKLLLLLQALVKARLGVVICMHIPPRTLRYRELLILGGSPQLVSW